MPKGIFRKRTSRLLRLGLAGAVLLALVLMSGVISAGADPGGIYFTPAAPPELPFEVELELASTGALKQAPLWKETIQLLINPYLVDNATETAPGLVRRPGFGATMPALNVWSLDRNVLTDEPFRVRSSDGEISWDIPGTLFDPDEPVTPPTDPNYNYPAVQTAYRTVIGELVAVDAVVESEGEEFTIPKGYLVMRNPETDPEMDPTDDEADDRMPPEGTIVAVPAFFDGLLHELVFDNDGNLEYEDVNGDGFFSYNFETGEADLPEYEEILDFTDDIPVNETDFYRPTTDTAGVAAPLRPYIGRPGAEVLGKALFWDQQVGSDGVQACGSCHFAAGADNRTQNQLNPNTLGEEGNAAELEIADPNQSVVAGDFPFHKLADPDIIGEPLLNPGNVVSDSDDVMSSMGVRFRLFNDIPTPGSGAFGPPTGPAGNQVRPLLPDLGTAATDPVAAAFVDPASGENLRRVEPRNTPTMIAAAFNFDNFWDGRAREKFNGGSVFGAADPFYHTFVDPGNPGPNGGPLQPANMGHFRPDLVEEDPEVAEQPIRIIFSSLASQAVGPPLSDFEMSFQGRNWPKIGKKLLQGSGTPARPNVTPLANQLVDPTDSVLGPFSNQGGSLAVALGRPTAVGKPGLAFTYPELIRLAFRRDLWQNNGQHFEGAVTGTAGFAQLNPVHGGPDPFDGFQLAGPVNGAAQPGNTNHFNQMEANFSLFFGLAAQSYEELLVPDDTPFDKFMDANPNAAFGVSQPGEQGNLPSGELLRELVGPLTLIPDDPNTPYYDGFGADEVLGFDIFSGANLTAALVGDQVVDPVSGANRNPAGHGSNPFFRTARCMLCHLGPEQTDHSGNVLAGLLHSNTEIELPPNFPPEAAAEPTGPFKFVSGLLLAEEFEGVAQDVIEIEARDMAVVQALADNPLTPWNDTLNVEIGLMNGSAFQDNGIYNIGLRPTANDVGRGGLDPFGWPLLMAELTMKNLAGADFAPPQTPDDPPAVMANFDPDIDFGGGMFEEIGDGALYPGTTYDVQSVNPGLETEPIEPMLPEYIAPWTPNLPAGEGHPQIDELAMVPNTVTYLHFGEFWEWQFGSDLIAAVYDPDTYPRNGWGPGPAGAALGFGDLNPNVVSASANNFQPDLNGTWPFANRVAGDGAFKVPQLRNVEMTGPYFHTGSYLTLRQVVDFYMRGGDFAVTNSENRDPNLVNLETMVFGLGSTEDLRANGGVLDGLPDTVSLYGDYPDTDHATTPEPEPRDFGLGSDRENGVEDVSVALVKFMLSMTDKRVKYERAPFDRPELFVPVDGLAPDNGDPTLANGGPTAGRAALLANSDGNLAAVNPQFRHLAALGAAGRPDNDPLTNFLGIASVPTADPIPFGQPGYVANDHFDR